MMNNKKNIYLILIYNLICVDYKQLISADTPISYIVIDVFMVVFQFYSFLHLMCFGEFHVIMLVSCLDKNSINVSLEIRKGNIYLFVS